MTSFAKALDRAFRTSGQPSLMDWCSDIGVSYSTIRTWMGEQEPSWLRTLRTIKRRTALSWGEILDGIKATRVDVSDESSDHAIGHSRCSECGKTVDITDRFCRHCGARLRTGGDSQNDV